MFKSQGIGSPDGMTVSPGGFEFGVQGWSYGEPRPKTITFFLDGTAMVCDQHGRPIRAALLEKEGEQPRELLFAVKSPQQDDKPGAREKLSTHQQVVEALQAEAVDWKRLTCAGWPQLSYTLLKELPALPPWPFSKTHDPASAPCRCVRCSIRDPKLRADSLRAYQEQSEELEKGVAGGEDD